MKCEIRRLKTADFCTSSKGRKPMKLLYAEDEETMAEAVVDILLPTTTI